MSISMPPVPVHVAHMRRKRQDAVDRGDRHRGEQERDVDGRLVEELSCGSGRKRGSRGKFGDFRVIGTRTGVGVMEPFSLAGRGFAPAALAGAARVR
jgi:hypothetical protein